VPYAGVVGSLASVTIPGRFNGPPDSANGGYACGTLARFVDGPAEVTLLSPPPLDRLLKVAAEADGVVSMRDGEVTVAEARPVDRVDTEPPVRPDSVAALDAQTRHPFLGMDHPFSTCYVCGAARDDGLGIHFGPLADHPHVNSGLLRPDAGAPTDGAHLTHEILWAILDCPSYAPELYGRLALLGRFSAELLREADPTEALVVVGWGERSEGRKHHTASAVVDADGGTVARARALWIEPRS
jgi:hypothetical protein